jgi:hypothetical protein
MQSRSYSHGGQWSRWQRPRNTVKHRHFDVSVYQGKQPIVSPRTSEAAEAAGAATDVDTRPKTHMCSSRAAEKKETASSLAPTTTIRRQPLS